MDDQYLKYSIIENLSSIEALGAHFNAYLTLDAAEKQALSERAAERKIKRRQFILQENDVCRHYSFIVSGCFKMYRVDDNGFEHNLQFAAENDWITDMSSFYSGQPSRFYIEAVEPSVILQIEKSNLLYLFTTYPKFDRNFRVIIENKFIELQNRVLQNISSSAEERYLTFLAEYPQLSNRLPNTQIASYIGVTPEFLSKIRKDLSRK